MWSALSPRTCVFGNNSEHTTDFLCTMSQLSVIKLYFKADVGQEEILQTPEQHHLPLSSLIVQNCHV